MSPTGQGLPEGPPDQRQRSGWWRKNLAQPQGSQSMGGKHCQSDRPGRVSGGLGQTRLHSSGPPGAYGLNENRCPSHWSHGGHGAEHSAVTQTVGPFSNKNTAITVATGDHIWCPLLMVRQCNHGCHEVRHEFLYLPDCPVVLMGRDFYANCESR
jgi:hypothetical protein